MFGNSHGPLGEGIPLSIVQDSPSERKLDR